MREILYFWTMTFAIRLVGIFSGKYSRRGVKNFVFSNGVSAVHSKNFRQLI